MLILVSLLVQLGLLLRIQFTAPPEFFLFPYLTNLGLRPYVDIVDQHAPGFLLSPFNFAALGIVTPANFHLLFIGVSLLQTLLVWGISRHFFTTRLALLVSFFHALTQPLLSTGYIWYETFVAFFLVLCLFLLTRRLFFLAGLAAAFMLLWKQTSLVFLLPLLWYLFSHFRSQLIKFALGLFTPLVFYLLYLLLQSGLVDFLYWAGLFNFTYAASAALPFPTGLLFSLGLFSLPLLRLRQSWFLILYLLGYLGLFIRFSPPTLQLLVPGLALCVGLLFSHPSKLFRFWFVVCFSLFLNRFAVFSRPPANFYPFFDPQLIKVSHLLKSYSQTNEEVLLIGAQPHLYVLSQLRPPGNYFVYQLPWYLSDPHQHLLSTYTGIRPRLVLVDTQAGIDQRSLTTYSSSLLEFTLANYQPLAQEGDYVLYELKP